VVVELVGQWPRQPGLFGAQHVVGDRCEGMLSEVLTWRRLSPSPKLNRMTSRILRMATRGLGNGCSSDGTCPRSLPSRS
jgi:hypothetical protein